MAKILLAEDNENLGFLLKDNLSEMGHQVSWQKNGKDAFEDFKKNVFEICILDVMMPGLDGFELAREIRKINEFLPILFLTAKSAEEDRLLGFEIGGDDYITKPFSIQELNYRIQVFLRRSKNNAESKESGEIFRFGNSTFDSRNLNYSCEGSNDRTLTHMEGELLKILLSNLNNLVKREEILLKVWGENDYFKGRSLDVFITRLRKYFHQDPYLEIRNHHGVGFTLFTHSAEKK